MRLERNKRKLPGSAVVIRKRRWITRLRQRIGWRGRCGGRLAATENRKQWRKGWSCPWVGRRQQVVPAQKHWRGWVFRPYRSMFTRAGTNGVDKSFSSGCCGETGVMATSEMRFPQRVRVQIPAVTQKSFALMQGDLLFRPIDVIGQAVGDVASFSCRKRITRARARENSA